MQSTKTYVRHRPSTLTYNDRKTKMQTKLIRKKWREDKQQYRRKKRESGFTHLAPPPISQLGAGLEHVPPAPQDLLKIAAHVKKTVGTETPAAAPPPSSAPPTTSHAPQQLGGSKEEMEKSTVTPHDEVITCRELPTVFRHPTQIIVSGPTKAGKTTLVTQILANRDAMFNPPLGEIYWFYSMEMSVQKPQEQLPGVHFVQGEPSIEKLEAMDPSVPKLIVLDDLMHMVETKLGFESLKKLFTAISHHCNMSVIFIVQDLYVSRNMCRLANQSENTIVMTNGSACYQIKNLAQKLFGPGHGPFITWCVAHAKSQSSHGYLLLSTGAAIPDSHRVTSFILPSDKNRFYVKKGTFKDPSYQRLREHAEAKEAGGSR